RHAQHFDTIRRWRGVRVWCGNRDRHRKASCPRPCRCAAADDVQVPRSWHGASEIAMTDTDPPILPELYCRDINLTKEFYLGVLGFRLMYERPEDKFVRIER